MDQALQLAVFQDSDGGLFRQAQDIGRIFKQILPGIGIAVLFRSCHRVATHKPVVGNQVQDRLFDAGDVSQDSTGAGSDLPDQVRDRGRRRAQENDLAICQQLPDSSLAGRARTGKFSWNYSRRSLGLEC